VSRIGFMHLLKISLKSIVWYVRLIFDCDVSLVCHSVWFLEEPFRQKCDVYSGLYCEGIPRYDCFLEMLLCWVM